MGFMDEGSYEKWGYRFDLQTAWCGQRIGMKLMPMLKIDSNFHCQKKILHENTLF